MVKLVANNGRKINNNNRLPKLKIVVEKLQKSLSLGRRLSTSSWSSWEAYDRDYEEFDDGGYDDVPEDVKEGYFAAIASEGEDPKRFVIPITYLTNPRCLRLLKESAETYRFDHVGALSISCRSSELEKILMNSKLIKLNP